jgi:predicted PhzF superfamily epimerase YddE/YHI9
MRLPIYQVDAFADRLFAGNPAAVVLLDAWPDDALLQSIAAENNLAETAYLVPEETGYALRWFTPVLEMDLCGHATLAAADVVFRVLRPDLLEVRFSTRRAGPLTVARREGRLWLDLPARPPGAVDVPPGLLTALGGAAPQTVLAARDLLVVFETADPVRALAPDMAGLARLDRMVIVTAPSDLPGVDFVSRFFAPGHGIPEDPVTGSAHCTLVPYWAGRLGRDRLAARQLSARGGSLDCILAGDRVVLGGLTQLYLEGVIHV